MLESIQCVLCVILLFTVQYCSNLIQRWVGDLTECLILHKELVDKLNLQPLLDSLALELLTLSKLPSSIPTLYIVNSYNLYMYMHYYHTYMYMCTIVYCTLYFQLSRGSILFV